MEETSTAVLAVPAIVTASKAEQFREVVTTRMQRSTPLRLIDYVPVYATTHEIDVETARQYRMTAGKIEEWNGGPVHLHDLSELFVSAFLRDYSQTVRPATVRSKRTQLMALWRSAADEYLCDPPTRRVRSARVPWVSREAWTIEEVRELVRAASFLQRRTKEGIPRSEWFDLAIRIAWDTGLRWGDMIRLRRENIVGNYVMVAQSKTRRPKVGRLSLSTLLVMEESLARHPRHFVTPWRRSHETFTNQVRRLVAKARVRPGTWKWLRRGGATDVEIQRPGQGMAARHLGHAPGSKVPEINYLDHSQIAEHVPLVAPTEIG